MVLSLTANASTPSGRSQEEPQSIAFARYIASLENPNPFSQPGLVGVVVEASLPQLYKDAVVVAICDSDASARRKCRFLDVEGDGAVVNEVVARFFAMQSQAGDRPASSIAITPANYRFRYAGEVRTGESSAYIYKIRPKKSQPGTMVGEIWLDSGTGAELMLKGRVNEAHTIGHADVVRETKMRDGSARARVTHLTFGVPRLGPSEIVVTECLLQPEDGLELPPHPRSTSRKMFQGFRLSHDPAPRLRGVSSSQIRRRLQPGSVPVPPFAIQFFLTLNAECGPRHGEQPLSMNPFAAFFAHAKAAEA